MSRPDIYWAANKLRGRPRTDQQREAVAEREDFANRWLNWAIGDEKRRRFTPAKPASECVSLSDEAKAEIAKRLGVGVKQ